VTDQEVMSKLQEVFDEIFVQKIRLTKELTAEGIEEWDSLTHTFLEVAIEEKFSISFSYGAFAELTNIGDLIAFIKNILKSNEP
jgi:acyl carrier protein